MFDFLTPSVAGQPGKFETMPMKAVANTEELAAAKNIFRWCYGGKYQSWHFLALPATTKNVGVRSIQFQSFR